jgi:hypothetical protein
VSLKTLENVTLSDYDGRVGNAFQIWLDGVDAVPAELIEVRSLGFNPMPGGKQGGRESFALIFRVPGAWRHPQRIFRVDHAELGSMDIFLVPVGPDAKGMRLEAVFNFL